MAFPVTGLVNYWKLDEASGTRVDSHGTNHLTPTNAPVGAAGKIGTACDFESTSSQYLSHPDPSPLGDEDWTYTFWFKRESAVGAELSLLGKDDGSPARSYNIRINTDGFLYLTFYTPFVQARVYSPNFNDTAWHFVVAWHDATANTVNLEVDNGGTGEDPSYGTYVPPAGNLPLRIGGRQQASAEDYFDGLIDEVGLWRRVLTAQERSDLYNGGAGLTYPVATGGDNLVLSLPTPCVTETFPYPVLTLPGVCA